MLMRWPGLTLDQYEEAREKVRWEEETPAGANFHVVGRDGDDLRVVDIWDSAADFQRFVDERLMPVIHEMGIESEPEVRFYDVHRVFAPHGVPAGAGVLA
jgi:heme-degrading monooxygenase HmoA